MEWITWALQGLIAAVMLAIWGELRANTRGLAALELKLSEHYVTKDFELAVRTRLHEIEDWIAGRKAIEQLARMRGEL